MEALLSGIGIFFGMIGFGIFLALVGWMGEGFPKFWK